MQTAQTTALVREADTEWADAEGRSSFEQLAAALEPIDAVLEQVQRLQSRLRQAKAAEGIAGQHQLTVQVSTPLDMVLGAIEREGAIAQQAIAKLTHAMREFDRYFDDGIRKLHAGEPHVMPTLDSLSKLALELPPTR